MYDSGDWVDNYNLFDMIDVTELRVGNWLYSDTGEDGTIRVMLDDFEAIQRGYAHIYSPIYLTPEVFEKCRFVEYWLYFEGGMFYYDSEGVHVHLNDGDGVLMPHIKHIHQLQNLYYALTGEELNYEL